MWTTDGAPALDARDEDQSSHRDIWNLNLDPPLAETDRYIGKVISQKPIKMSVINSVLDKAWDRYGLVRKSETAPGILLLEFACEEDRCKIIDMSPWAINGHILSIKKWEPSVGLSEVDFHKVQFWVQVHDLGYRNSAKVMQE